MSVYDSLSTYFSTSGGTGNPGQGGGAGYSSDVVSGGAKGGSGYGASSDVASFSNPFTQSYGGITNNQVINSPGASPYNAQGILPAQSPTSGIVAMAGGGGSQTMLMIVLAGLLALSILKR